MWKLTVILFLSLACAAQAPSSAAQEPSPDALAQDAIQKQQSGDLEGAIAEYKQFLKIHPEAGPIHANLGAALAGLGRYEEALAEYRTALKMSPSLATVRLNLSLAYYKMGRISDAAVELARVHREAPSNKQATLLLADCYLRMDQNKDVIRVLEPAEKEYPDDLAIAYMLGTALIREKRVSDGQILVDRILRNGDSAEAHLMMGSAKIGVADFAGARDELAKAVALNPDLPEVHVLYAQALQVTGDPDQALKEFKAELAVDPYNFESNLHIGAMLREDQNNEEAIKYLNRALETRPKDLGVRYQLAAIALSEGKLDGARSQLESIIKEAPQFTEAHVSLSIVYYRLKRPEDGKRERDIVEKLTAAAQAKQPGVQAKQPGVKVQ